MRLKVQIEPEVRKAMRVIRYGKPLPSEEERIERARAEWNMRKEEIAAHLRVQDEANYGRDSYLRTNYPGGVWANP